MAKATKLSALDLFSGAGGFSLAALNCKFNLLGAVELDPQACRTYKSNIIEKRSPSTILFSENILTLDPEDIRNKLKLSPRELDILLGGPPCQGFSSHRINGQGIDDPRNALLLTYFDFVKALNPKVFLVENVPGLLWKRHDEYLKKFKNLSNRHGYRVLGPVKLNAKDYGVPQNRQRVFILGVRSDLDAKGLQWPPPATHFHPRGPGPSWRTASTVFEKPPVEVLEELKDLLTKKEMDELKFGEPIGDESRDASAIRMQHTSTLTERFENTPLNGSRSDSNFRLPCHSRDYTGHKDVYGRIRLAQPGPTVTTGCVNPSRGRFLHPWLNHGIFVRQAARLQTFPDDYVFSSGIISQGKQIGNAVPVKLGEVLLESLREFLVK